MFRGVLFGIAVSLSTISLSLVNPSVAWSQDDAAASLIEEAHTHYSAKNFAKSADAFYQAYKIRGAPELCYNAARAAEKALESKLAILYYSEFLALKGTLAEHRTKARTSLKALENEEKNRSEPPANETLPDDGQTPAPVMTNNPTLVTAEPMPQKASGSSSVLKWGAVAAAATGLGVGTGFYISGMGDETAVEDAASGVGVATMTMTEADQRLADAASKKTTGAIFMGVGGAFAVSAVVLFVLDSGGDNKESMAITPLLGETRGFAVGGTF